MGKRLVNYTKNKLNDEHYVLSTVLDETNLEAQLFLKSQEFKATHIKKKFFGVNDGYLFEYGLINNKEKKEKKNG